eukprot:SM000093S24440  [mRNA]  locus=s93:371862:382919:- [translate_table: standard]
MAPGPDVTALASSFASSRLHKAVPAERPAVDPVLGPESRPAEIATATNGAHFEDVQKEGWRVRPSELALATVNPIRIITDDLRLDPSNKKSLISLAQGDPTMYGHLQTADVVTSAIVKATEGCNFNGYTHSQGLLECRTAVGAFLSERLPYKIPPAHIYITAGTTAVYVSDDQCRPEQYFAATPRLPWICAVAEAVKVPIIADEVYYDMTFDQNVFTPMAAVSRRVPVLTVGSISKRWLVPGCRLGWLVIHDPHHILRDGQVVEAIAKVAQIKEGTCTANQAAVADFMPKTPSDYLPSIMKELQAAAAVCYEHVKRVHGLQITSQPQGGMFLMVKMMPGAYKDINNDIEFAAALLKEEAVAVVPGEAFKMPNFLRLFFAVPIDFLEEAWQRRAINIGNIHFAASMVVLLDCIQFFSIEGWEGPVFALNATDFKSEVEDGSQVYLMLFIQENCEPCAAVSPCHHLLQLTMAAPQQREVVPDYTRVAKKLEGIVKAYSWEKTKNPYTGELYKHSAVYKPDGPFNVKEVADLATDLDLPYKVWHLQVLLFSKKDNISPLYKAMSLLFRRRLHFAQAQSSDTELISQFGATKFPAMYVEKAEGTRVEFEVTSMKAPELYLFLEMYAAPTPAHLQDEQDDNKSSREAPTEQSDGKANTRLPERLAAANFSEVVLNSDDLWIVGLISSEANDELLQGWRGATQAIMGLVKVGELVMYEDDTASAKLAEEWGAVPELQQANISILIFPFGVDSKQEEKPEIYRGALEAKELHKVAMEALPSSFIAHLGASTLQSFAGADVQKPKALLFTKKTEVPCLLKALSCNYHDFLDFGMVNANDKMLVTQFDVKKFPELVLLMANPDSSDELDFKTQHYQGPLTYASLSLFFDTVVGAMGLAAGKAVHIREITGDEAFKDICVETGRLCVLGAFKGNGSSVLGVLKEVAAKWAPGGQFSFAWIDMPNGASFMSTLGVMAAQVPTVVVLSPRKMRYAQLQDGYRASSLDSMLDGLLSGKVKTLPLEVLPSFEIKIQDTVELADEEPVIEEEFSLEDILGEELEGDVTLGTKAQRLQEIEKELEEEARQKEAEAAAAAEQEKKAKKKKKKKKKKKTSTDKDEL